jgi:FkbM family methyltransferase
VGVPPVSEIAFIRSALRQGGVAMDIGANVGTMALLMAHSGASVVHAFEPSYGTADVLARTAKQYASIEVHRAAMSDHAGSALFIDTPGASATNKLADDGHLAGTVIVHTDTIDAFRISHRIERIVFLKIDVEGFEPRVIRGAIGTLSERRVALGMIEIIPQLLRVGGSSTHELGGLLAGLGYSIRNIETDGSIGQAINLEAIHPTAMQNFALVPT